MNTATTNDYMADVPAPRVSDEWLELWGNVFVANNIYAHGITFILFLSRPREILDALARRRLDHYAGTEDFEPLLPAQARVQRQSDLRAPLGWADRLESDLDEQPGVVNRNGTWIERLHHCAWPRSADRRAS